MKAQTFSLIIFGFILGSDASGQSVCTKYAIDYSYIPPIPKVLQTTLQTIECPQQPPQISRSSSLSSMQNYIYPGSYNFSNRDRYGRVDKMVTVCDDKSLLDGLKDSEFIYGTGFFGTDRDYRIEVAGVNVRESVSTNLTPDTGWGESTSHNFYSSDYNVVSGQQTLAGTWNSTIYSKSAGDCKYTFVSSAELLPTTVQWFRSTSNLPPATPVDLKVLSVRVSGSPIARDSKPYTNPQTPITVEVVVSGSGITSSETRFATIDLQIGRGLTARSIAAQVSLNSLAAGNPVAVPINVTFLDGDAGNQELKATINAAKEISESLYTNNSASTGMHVFCDASVKAIKPIPFWSQVQSPWGNKAPYIDNNKNGYAFGPYGAATRHYMHQYGCYLTDIMMAAGTYGIDQTVKGLYIAPDAVVSPQPEELVSLDPGVLDLASMKQTTDGKYTMFDGDNNPNGVGIQDYLRLAWAKSCVANGNGSATECSELMSSAITFKPDKVSYDPDYVQTQLCMGNPIVLQLKIPARPAKPGRRARAEHSHFVLARAQTVDANGNPSYMINDPGSSDGRNVALYDSYPESAGHEITGQRVYLHGADPSFFQVRASEQIEVVITDPSGKRYGKNPQTGEVLREIAGVVQYQETSPNENLDDETPDQVASNVTVHNASPTDGKYKVEIYATQSGVANVEVDGYDLNGYLNQLVPFSATLKAGQKVQLDYDHKSIPLQSTSIDLQKSLYVDRKVGHDDSVYLHGKIVLPAGVDKLTLNQVLSIRIGSITRRIDAKDFKKKRFGNRNFFVYRDFKDAVTLIRIEDDGRFWVKLGDAGLSSADVKTDQKLDIHIDNVYAKTDMKFTVVGHERMFDFRDKDFFECLWNILKGDY